MIAFPHPIDCSPDGILAIGGDLSSEVLELAYSFGIFPWFTEGEPILWWFPNPRMVLLPNEIRVSKSMRSYFNGKKFQFTMDRDFQGVISSCQQVKREGQEGTWIGEELMQSLIELHKKGMAHSVEVWKAGKLVGGLYGIAVGKIFFGESMFSLESNASKFALIVLARILKRKGFCLIDCQQETPHLASMGAKTVGAANFYRTIKMNLLNTGQHKHSWSGWEGDFSF